MTTPLPEPSHSGPDGTGTYFDSYTAADLRDYGAKCEKTLTAALQAMTAERDELRAHLHTCGPTCTKAGCINSRQSKELEQLTETSVWQAGRISELLDDAAAQRKVLEQALEALQILSCEADSFSVSGVYFNESCMGHKGLDMAETAITAIQEQLK